MKNRIFLICAILLPALLLGGLRAAFTPAGNETSEDAFWHVAAGRRSFGEMLSKKFPLTLSVWRDHYADKELLFHVLLKAYGGVKSLFYSPLEPPFTGASFVFMLLFFAMFAAAAHSLGIAPPKILLASLVCALLVPNFTYRLMMLRPHVFSMALMMGAVALLARGPARKNVRFGMFALGFLYAWSYSSPHLVCITAFLFGLGWFMRERWKAFYPFLCSVAGVFCGLLLHPQSPNTFYVWKVQALDALFAPIAGRVIDLPFALELLPPRFFWILMALPAVVAAYFCLMALIRMLETRRLREIPPNLLALLLSSLFWTATMCTVSVRPVEYAVPMLCLAGFLLMDYVQQEELFRWNPRVTWILPLILIVFGGAYTLSNCVENLRFWCNPAPTELTKALRNVAPAGTRVVNIIWSDFPYLSFAAPEYEYTWALDPMFAYAADPERTAELGQFGRNGKRQPPERLGALLDADYAVVLFEKNPCGQFLERTCGWRPVYKGADGWLFRLR